MSKKGTVRSKLNMLKSPARVVKQLKSAGRGKWGQSNDASVTFCKILVQIENIPLSKGGLNLNAVFPPLSMGLVEISRSRFKQYKNSMLINYSMFKRVL